LAEQFLHPLVEFDCRHGVYLLKKQPIVME